jgi:hypothetical protein
VSDPDPDRDPAAQIRETITQSDHEELPVRSVIGRTTLSEREVVEAADSDEAFEFDHGIGLIRLVDTTANEIRSDGGQGTADRPDTEAESPRLSLLFDDGSVRVNSPDKNATVQARPDHGQVRLEATETGDRTVDAVIEGSPEAMAGIADQIYQAAATAAHENDDIDPLDGDVDE